MNERAASLHAGYDLISAGANAAAHWDALQALRGEMPEGYWLVIIPDVAHELVAVARENRDSIRLAKIVPDMADGDRLKVVQALRANRVDMLFVTPERLGQEKFVQFIEDTDLALVVIAAAQYSLPEAGEFSPAYDVLKSLRDKLPEIPIWALWDGDEVPAGGQQAVISALKLTVPLHDSVAREHAIPSPRTAPPTAPAPRTSVRTAPEGLPLPAFLSEDWARALPMLEREESLADIAAALGVEESWCIEALIYFIRKTGRTKPFPWVDQPSYLAVAVAVGQTESTEARTVIPVVGGGVPEAWIRVSLAALQNRALIAPNRSA